ncbi:hypothetical protein IPC1432_01525 [Pseudomonas aeruginosa]|uniref:Syntaxin-5 N-terminal Sly1p-binding domain-containing protein n=1 Tax=Pseudomonas aeruginosa TaxID=287 RepID=A0A6A9JXY0_PSEAI|nr:hypothetical protein [Pseudomonas aeruginosa]MCO1766840.1 hypothetical protein [Pseudomonas aeruginosa]MUI60115.1 hypothetical protein [Pseudomonas aeruginosa]RTU09370.1 hypothetical protein DY968_27815 [Pseudomonas aeruginosa]RTU36773.1 hypothetical protein DY973_14415 [Pseudomonas aeruginosa]
MRTKATIQDRTQEG